LQADLGAIPGKNLGPVVLQRNLGAKQQEEQEGAAGGAGRAGAGARTK